MSVSFLKEHSHKYAANILQITGVAFSSAIASKIFIAATSGDISELTLNLLSTRLCLILLGWGIILIIIGWYIMYRVDKRKSELKEKP